MICKIPLFPRQTCDALAMAYIYYVAYVTAFFFLQANLNGLSFQFLWPNYPQWNNLSLAVFGAAGLAAHQPRQLFPNRLSQTAPVEVRELGQAVDLNQDAGNRKPVAPAAGELRLHQVQDLRL